MKHLKLFEQLDWENDPFGEDSIVIQKEFEVGDRVRILNNDGGGCLEIGSIGIIERVGRSSVMVRGKNYFGYPYSTNCWQYRKGDLEKV